MKLTVTVLAAGSLLAISACAVDPATQTAPPGYGNAPNAAPYGNDPYYDRDDRYNGDPRYAPDPRYNNGQYSDRGERYWDERARRYYYVDRQTGYTYWDNGEFRSR